MKTIGKVWNKVGAPAFWIVLMGMLFAGGFMVDTIIGKVLLITPIVICIVLYTTLVVIYLLSLPERRELEKERGLQRDKGATLSAGIIAAEIVKERRKREGKRTVSF